MKLFVENLSVNRGGRSVIEGLSFTVSAGEALIVKGTNGSGKTTLLRTLAGFLKPETGRIKLHDVVLKSDDVPVVHELSHYVGHLNGVKASQTVWETLSFYATFFEPSAQSQTLETRLETALDSFQLSALASIPCGYLSAGQKRRLGLARLLCVPRPIWLLDEPTTSLDQKSSTALSEIITEHVATGGMVIAATHLDLGLATSNELQLGAEARAA